MIEPETRRNEASRARAAAPSPILRLVLAFKESSDEARPCADPSDEAYHAEALFLAAEAAYEALSRFADRWHEAAHGERPPAGLEDWQALVDGFEAWLYGAEALFERLEALQGLGYDSGSADRLRSWMYAAAKVSNDDWDRKAIERKAPRADRLAAIAARPRPDHHEYD